MYFTVRHINGKLVVCGGRSLSGRPEGPYYAFPEPLVTHNDGAIDASFVREQGTGKNFLLYKVDGNAFGRQTPIYIVEMNEDGTRLIGQHRQILINDRPWEAHVIEGPWIHYHNGYYFLFYSGNGYASPGYAVGVARSKSITGPYEKAAAPILSQVGNRAKGHYFAGPGHNSVIHIPNNNVDVMIYHSWLSGHINSSPGRVVAIDRIWWTENNWPVVGIAGTPSHRDLPDPRSREFADMPMDVRVRIGSMITLASYQWADHCWASNNATIDGNCGDRNNFLYVREGLAGHGTVSFESVSRPGFFWRHANGKLQMNYNDGSPLFRQDSSFIPVAGFQDQGLLSLRPVNFPFNCIRHRYGELIHDAWKEDGSEGEDATWRVSVKSLSNNQKFLEE